MNNRLILEVEGINSKDCIKRISEELKFIDAYNVEIDMPLKIIKVDFIGSETESNKYIQKLNNLGYKATKLAIYDLNEVHNS